MNSSYEERQQAYVKLIQALLNCPDVEKSKILTAQQELVDEGLVTTALEIAKVLNEEDRDAAESTVHWLVKFAYSLSQQLELEAFSMDDQFNSSCQQKIYPLSYSTWLEQGIMLNDLGMYEEAIETFDRAIQLEPDSCYEAWAVRGIAQGNLGGHIEALFSYDQAIRLKPDDYGAWMNRGIALCDFLEEYEESLRSFNQAIQINPIEHWPFCNRGNALANLGRFIEALSSYDRAIDLKSDFHEAWTYRGDTLAKLDKCIEAIASYDRAIDIEPSNYKSWLNRGIVLDTLGRNKEAVKSYERAIKINPDIVSFFSDQNDEKVSRYEHAINNAINKNTNQLDRQIYLDFIEELLNCPPWKEEALLATKPEMVNERLISIMLELGQVSSLEDCENEEFNCNWLTRFAVDLSERLNLRIDFDNNKNILEWQIYSDFLEKLLICPAEQIHDFLISKPEMVNNKLAAMISEKIQVFARKGIEAKEESKANRLLYLSNHLSEYLNLDIDSDKDDSQVQFEFLITILQLIEQNSDTQQVIYPLLEKNVNLLGEKMIPALSAWAHFQLPKCERDNQKTIALRIGIFATLIDDFSKGVQAENRELSIHCYKILLDVFDPIEDPNIWALTQKKMGIAFQNRIRGDKAKNIEKSIECIEASLNLLTVWDNLSSEWAHTQLCLGNTYILRIKEDNAENIELAIICYKAALQVYNEVDFPEQWGSIQNNLGSAYYKRIRGVKARNQKLSIDYFKSALKVRTEDDFPKYWAMTQNNLGRAYTELIYGDKSKNLENSIDCFKAALEIRTKENSSTDWAMTQNNLAISYLYRIEGDRGNNLENSINCFEAALEVYSRQDFLMEWAWCQNNLANVYRNKIIDGESKNIEKSINYYRQSLIVFSAEAFPNECLKTSRYLAELESKINNWDSASESYQNALAALEILYQSCNLLYSKDAKLRESSELHRSASYAYAKAGHFHSAVMAIEAGRARVLSENLERDRANLLRLAQISSNLEIEYQDITKKLRVLESDQRQSIMPEQSQGFLSENLRNKANDLRMKLDKTVAQIRQQPGYEEFLFPPSFEDILSATQPQKPIIYIIPAEKGTIGLIVIPTEIIPVWIDNFTQAKLQSIVEYWFDAYYDSRNNFSTWQQQIEQATQQLWLVMEPIISQLKLLNLHKAILIPTGLLSLLPLHAAWENDPETTICKRYALDEVNFTYAPNARSINLEADISKQVVTDSILAIDDPLQNLPSSSKEISTAITTFTQYKVLKHNEATIESVLAALPDFNILHLSCHGSANLNEPLTSGLLMSDGLLTLRDILDIRLDKQGGIRLAILSACETGLNGLELVDEVIGLPAGLLQAGVSAVISSLWSVDDFSTCMLLNRFYDFWRQDNVEPSSALRQAQQWVRDTSNGEKLTYFTSKSDDYFCKYLILSHPDDHDFAHPFHWAAFSYFGV